MEEVSVNMNTAKERLLKIIDEIPEQEVNKILDFAEFLKAKKEKSLTKDLTKASESSLDFWDNDIDDEVWNNV
jgi:Ca2+-binding EF-hand superfamily protein